MHVKTSAYNNNKFKISAPTWIDEFRVMFDVSCTRVYHAYRVYINCSNLHVT